ncbi:ComEA family DNA-binding protein [Roseovarius ramblicola]|uniref:ComEA family DNA-binding protein n=1 Tax=Roseovarius ramblicola TaxID=2022336 RepID=A0ABV5HYN1_9RHOB
MTDYIRRATIVCDKAGIPDANQLALVLGESAADDRTFRAARYQDTSGNLYAASSTVATGNFEVKAASPLIAPPHAPDADLAAASRAQATIYIHGVNGTEGAVPGRLWVMLAPASASAAEALSLAGVAPVPPVNINSPDAAEIERLDGVGPSLSQAIIDGQPWADPAKLSQIDGISDAMVAGWQAGPGVMV